MPAVAELTVGPPCNGIAAWCVRVHPDQGDVERTVAAISGYVDPAVAFLAARGGGLMVLPLPA